MLRFLLITAACTARPSILIVMTDDQSPETIEHMPFFSQWYKENATVFSRAFVNSPLCAPSRASFLTGMTPVDARTQFTSSDETEILLLNNNSFARTLKDEYGYRTGYFGKLNSRFSLMNTVCHLRPSYEGSSKVAGAETGFCETSARMLGVTLSKDLNLKTPELGTECDALVISDLVYLFYGLSGFAVLLGLLTVFDRCTSPGSKPKGAENVLYRQLAEPGARRNGRSAFVKAAEAYSFAFVAGTLLFAGGLLLFVMVDPLDNAKCAGGGEHAFVIRGFDSVPMNHLPATHRPLCAPLWVNPYLYVFFVLVWVCGIVGTAIQLRLILRRRSPGPWWPTVLWTSLTVTFVVLAALYLEPEADSRVPKPIQYTTTRVPTESFLTAYSNWSIDGGKTFFNPTSCTGSDSAPSEETTYGTEYGDGYYTSIKGNLTLDFVRESMASGTPYLAIFAPFAPHGPASTAPWHREGRHSTVQRRFQNAKSPRTADYRKKVDHTALTRQQEPITDNEARALDRLYRNQLGSLLAVDDSFRELWLEVEPHTSDTLIIYTTDNSVHYGHHGLFYGKRTLYDHDVRVPFVVAGLGAAPRGNAVDYPVQLMDLAPSIIEMARDADQPPQYSSSQYEGSDISDVLKLQGVLPSTYTRVVPVMMTGVSADVYNAKISEDFRLHRHPQMHSAANFCGARYFEQVSGAVTTDASCFYTLNRENGITGQVSFDHLSDPHQLDASSTQGGCWTALNTSGFCDFVVDGLPAVLAS